MLDPEQARKTLEKLETKEWVQQRLQRAGKLPGPLRRNVRYLLGYDDQGKELDNWGEQFAVAEELEQMRATERLAVFEHLFPTMAPHVENAWQLNKQLPYSFGYSRCPFRAPNNPAITSHSRFSWLHALTAIVGPYQQDLAWFAAWVPHLGAGDQLGILLAAALDAGGKEGDEIYQILTASARGEHEIGGMGRHVIRAFLVSSREDCWEFIEKMLLAAQREEGLRQAILECADDSNPRVFPRLLRLIHDQNLARFSSVIRSLDGWLGYQWDAISVGVVNQVVEKLLLYFDEPSARAGAIRGKDPEQAYLALWTVAFENVMDAIGPAAELLQHKNAGHRFVSALLLKQFNLPSAQEKLIAALDDDDLRVAACALERFRWNVDMNVQKLDLFERLEKLLPRFPRKKTKLNALVWPWAAREIEDGMVASALVSNLGERSPTRLIPHVPTMEAGTRCEVARLLAASNKWDAATRDTLLTMVGDASPGVRETALRGLEKCAITSAEATGLEKLLTRTTGDLRRGVLTLLLKQNDRETLASADRLLKAGAAPQRLAGLELLRQLTEAKREANQCRSRAEIYRTNHPSLNDQERLHIDAILETGHKAASIQDALGLADPEKRTKPARPVDRKVRMHSPTSVTMIRSLDAFVHKHRETPVTIKSVDEDEDTESAQKVLLGEIDYGFPSPNTALAAEEDCRRLPLRELWERWWEERGPELRDEDGLELLRSLLYWTCGRYDDEDLEWRFVDPLDTDSAEGKRAFRWMKSSLQLACGTMKCPEPKYESLLDDVFNWFLRLHAPAAPAGGADFLLDALETTLALVPPEKFLEQSAEDPKQTEWTYYKSPVWDGWLRIVRQHRGYHPDQWSDAQQVRLWRLLRWMDEPQIEDKITRSLPELDELLAAHKAGGATQADVFDYLLGPGSRNQCISALTSRKPVPILQKYPGAQPLVERCRDRVLEIELARGDTPTAASNAALKLRCVWGSDTVVAILRSLGKRTFVRGYSYDNQSKETVLSHLARSCLPRELETVAEFKAKTAKAAIPEQRLVELAVYAPQWAAFVEQALGWKGIEEGVWWIHAHTKDRHWRVGEEIREEWKAKVNERTPLTGDELMDGAVDVGWFHRMHQALGEARWTKLDDAAKYASGGAGHARAQLFADAMLGRAKKKELVTRITQKRNQEAVRALGLLPLAVGKAHEADVLDRYKILQEFIRTSRQFGSQRQASEKRAAQIGQDNLARTAGYPDPLRLQWAMEAKAVADLAEGPIEATVESVTVSLKIDPWGEVEMSIRKDGQSLAEIPAKLKKNPKIAALRERKTELKRQASRMRASLEQLMCRGETFTGAELAELMKHPLLGPMLAHLVLVGEGVLGYPTNGGKTLEDCAGGVEALKKNEPVRIAHPFDLLPADKWHQWQRDCFGRERIQPFKQVFRELYVLTSTETDEGTLSRRYAGHQVQPRKAMALFGTRGWVADPEEGVRRTFHDLGISAWVEFLGGWMTPAEVEGLTIETVRFGKRGEWKPLKLSDVPPRVFSEVMRDLDLVVSVAHRGGIDPEASASTVEMRSALLRDTCSMLKITNVRLKDNHALIDGKLGQYSVHLGSAVIHRLPGGLLCVVPVHSQHRGRLFLPFADDDPKTAEVLSKVLLLARDSEIKDPNILDQLRSR